MWLNGYFAGRSPAQGTQLPDRKDRPTSAAVSPPGGSKLIAAAAPHRQAFSFDGVKVGKVGNRACFARLGVAISGVSGAIARRWRRVGAMGMGPVFFHEPVVGPVGDVVQRVIACEAQD